MSLHLLDEKEKRTCLVVSTAGLCSSTARRDVTVTRDSDDRRRGVPEKEHISAPDTPLSLCVLAGAIYQTRKSPVSSARLSSLQVSESGVYFKF